MEGARQTFTFQAEPIVVDVATWSVALPGDVVEAVNDEPITTRAGAEAFVNTPLGSTAKLQVRRGNDRLTLEMMPCAGYTPSGAVAQQAYGGGRVAAGGVASAQAGGRIGRGGAGGRAAMANAQSDITRDSVTSVVRFDRHGFVLRCTTPCVRAVSADGSAYWRFAARPTVRSTTSPNASAGLQATGLADGDIVVAVNGVPVTSEDASMLLTHSALVLPLELEVLRAGERRTVTLRKRE
jgi:hypothetical protein